eukprot:SAG31_NODE_11227_length_1052_cov_0.806925_1_plen_264_part_00
MKFIYYSTVHKFIYYSTVLPEAFSHSRRVQNDPDEMSLDTIAIALSVLVGAAGYIIQAYSARQADQAAEVRQQELQISETRRQREHEQMLAQIHRTERIVDECCGPFLFALWGHLVHCVCYSANIMAAMEETHPEIITAMAGFAARLYDVKDDGTLVGKTTGYTMWLGSPPAAITRTFNCSYHTIATSKQAMLWGVQLLSMMTAPWTAVMPEAVLGVIATDPNGEYAVEYRRFVRVTMLSGLKKMQEILTAHGPLLEMPSKEC